MLQEILPELTGFSLDHFSLNECVHEFNAKFAGGFMKLNNNIEYIRDCGYDENKNKFYIRIQRPRNHILYEEDVKELLPFRPKVGCYFIKSGFLIIFNKTARRMYKKTLTIGENYDIRVYDLSNKKFIGDYNIQSIFDSFTEQRQIKDLGFISKNRQFIFSKGSILFCGTLIGTYKYAAARILSFDTLPLWKQEILDVLHYELSD